MVELELEVMVWPPFDLSSWSARLFDSAITLSPIYCESTNYFHKLHIVRIPDTVRGFKRTRIDCVRDLCVHIHEYLVFELKAER